MKLEENGKFFNIRFPISYTLRAYNQSLHADAKGLRSLRSLHPFAPVSSIVMNQYRKHWSIQIKEASIGVYSMTAIFEDGMSVSITGTESDYKILLAKMHRISIDNDINPGLSAYWVTQAALSKEPAVFYSKMFGSWTVGKKDSFPRIDYDGRDFLLMILENKGKYSLECKIDELKNEKCHYFRKLSNMAGWGS